MVRNQSGNITIGESVTVTVAKSPVNSEKPVSIWRDDRCAEYDAVEWRLPAGGTQFVRLDPDRQ